MGVVLYTKVMMSVVVLLYTVMMSVLSGGCVVHSDDVCGKW